MPNVRATIVTAIVSSLLSGCFAHRHSALIAVPYPELIEDSTWVAARAISFARFVSVSEGYANQLNTDYTVTKYEGGADRVRVTLARSRPMMLGGGLTLEVRRNGEIRILGRTQ